MWIISAIIAIVIAALVIWLVGRLNMGLTVTGFVPALIAAVIIVVISIIVRWLLGLLGIGDGSGFIAAIVDLIISAVVLMIAGSFVPGMSTNGFVGALVAAIAIAVITWLLSFILPDSWMLNPTQATTYLVQFFI
jgi:putative membrane protein